MRHETDYQSGIERFEDELKLLVSITEDNNVPSAITKIYDCGFVSTYLSQTFQTGISLDANQNFISTGQNIKKFS